MNVKIQQQALKFKITQDELENLLKGQSLQSEVNLPNMDFYVGVQPCEPANDIHVAMTNKNNSGVMTLMAPKYILQKLHDIGRNRDGISYQHGDVLVTLQVDFRGDKRNKKES